MTYADLHMHSTASDGTLDPADLPKKARQSGGLFAMSLTDHDSLDGLDAAAAACEECGLAFVPGVEITTKHGDRPVHMLGYFVDPSGDALGEYLRANKERRRNRTYEIADRLAAGGFPVSADDLRAMEGTPNRPLLARLLVERGCVDTIDDAFRRLLCSSSPYYVEAVYPDAIEAIHVIADAGGCPFIAHPARYGVVDLIEPFAREGLVGLEAHHTLQSPEQSAELVRLAGRLGLAVSGGSDWHGDEVHRATPGGCGLDEEGYHCFLEACESARDRG